MVFRIFFANQHILKAKKSCIQIGIQGFQLGFWLGEADNTRERVRFQSNAPLLYSVFFLSSFKADVLPQEFRECKRETATEIWEEMRVQLAHSAKSNFSS